MNQEVARGMQTRKLQRKGENRKQKDKKRGGTTVPKGKKIRGKALGKPSGTTCRKRIRFKQGTTSGPQVVMCCNNASGFGRTGGESKEWKTLHVVKYKGKTIKWADRRSRAKKKKVLTKKRNPTHVVGWGIPTNKSTRRREEMQKKKKRTKRRPNAEEKQGPKP